MKPGEILILTISISCLLIGSTYLVVASDENETIDPQGDVLVMDTSMQSTNTTSKKPNIDIEKVTYSRDDESRKVTLTIEVYGNIEDKGDPEMTSSFEMVYYSIQLATSNSSDSSSELDYEVDYINRTCQMSYPNSLEPVNITDFSVNGGVLSVSFNLLSASETYENITASTFEIDSSYGIYMDMAPDEPMVVTAGGPYYGKVGEEINFSGSPYLGTPPYTYSWDFGDGHTASDANSTHSYKTAGEYNVTLTITDDTGQTANDTTTATISENENNTSGNNTGNNSNSAGQSKTNSGLILFAIVIAIIVIIGIIVIILIVKR